MILYYLGDTRGGEIPSPRLIEGQLSRLSTLMLVTAAKRAPLHTHTHTSHTPVALTRNTNTGDSCGEIGCGGENSAISASN